MLLIAGAPKKPTTEEQLVEAGIAVGVAAAIFTLYLGTVWAVDRIFDLSDKGKKSEEKSTKKVAEKTSTTPATPKAGNNRVEAQLN